MEHLDTKLAHSNKRLTSITQPTSNSGHQTIHFADGTTVDADVVLLANGIRGVGRDVVTGVDPKKNIAFANAVCYRGLAPAGPAKAANLRTDVLKRACIFVGTNKVQSRFTYELGKDSILM